MKWISGTIHQKVVWSEGLFTLHVHVPGVDWFEAGQFLQIGIEKDGKYLNNPYSVASPHGLVLEFFVVLVDDGRLTPQLWKMDPGDRLYVGKRAAGSFTLSRAPKATTLWLLGTGTGLAPYIAMLRTAQAWDNYENIVLVHGVRHKTDLAYQEELENYRHSYGNRFAYLPVVSREDIHGALRGRITTCLADGRLERAAGHHFNKDSCVMLCGNPAMLDDVERMLEERGLQRHKRNQPGHIVVERYW